MASKGNDRANIAACQRALSSDMRMGLLGHQINFVTLFLLECVSMLTCDMRRDGTFNQEVMGKSISYMIRASRHFLSR